MRRGQRKPARVLGPYHEPDRGRWRVVGVHESGTRLPQFFDTLEEAQSFVESARAALGCTTVGTAVNAFLAHLKAKGRRESTITTARYRLLAIFRLVERDMPIASVTERVAAELYARRAQEAAADTQRGELSVASALMAFAVKQGWAARDPFASVEPVGVKASGGETLRLDEARRFLAACLADDSTAGVACALAMLTGARASEITDRVVRDLDDGGRLLWVPQAKTAAGVRQLGVPELLRPRLVALTAGKAPTDRLWGDVDRHWLAYHVHRLCLAAKVPEVGPHALRRLYATIRVGQNHASVEAVARELGQAGPGVTRRHYLAPGTEDAARSELTAQLLTAERTEVAA